MSARALQRQKRKAKMPPGHKSMSSESSLKLIKKAKKIKQAHLQKNLVLSDESDENEERTRTPSGTELAGKVQGIRDFFSPLSKRIEKEVISPYCQQLVGQESVNRELISRNTMSTLTLDHDQRSDQNNQHSEGDRNNNVPPEVRKEIIQLSQEGYDQKNSENAILMHLASQLSSINEIGNIKSAQQSPSANNQLEPTESRMVSNREENDEENPKTIAISSVIQMMATIKSDISKEMHEMLRVQGSELREQIKQDIKSFKEECAKEAKTATDNVLVENPNFKKVQAEIAFWRIKAETLTEVCDRMNTEITDLSARIENIELNATRKKLIMTGIKLMDEKDKNACKLAIDEFLSQALRMKIVTDGYFTIGSGDLRPIVLMFSTLEKKKRVFERKSMLKNIRVDGRKIFISDYLPPSALEKRKRDQDIVASMRNSGDQEKLSYFKGNITIEGKMYKKMVAPPTPKELIDITPSEIEAILSTKTNRGDEFVKLGSRFVGYSAQVTSHKQINDIYKKIKMIKPGARHVVCAYIIDYDQEIYAKDYHDDGETGAGRILLEIMERYGVKQKAVFIARKYGGVKMGVDRYTCYTNALKSCLGIDINDEPDLQQQSPPQNQHNRRGNVSNYRGRGRGNYGRQNYRGARPKSYGGSNRTGSFQINFTEQNDRNTHQQQLIHSGTQWDQYQQDFPQLPQQQKLRYQQQTADHTTLSSTQYSMQPAAKQHRHFMSDLPRYQEEMRKAMQSGQSRYQREMDSLVTFGHKSHQRRYSDTDLKRADLQQKLIEAASSQASLFNKNFDSEFTSAAESMDEQSVQMDFSFSNPISRNKESWSADHDGQWVD